MFYFKVFLLFTNISDALLQVGAQTFQTRSLKELEQEGLKAGLARKIGPGNRGFAMLVN